MTISLRDDSGRRVSGIYQPDPTEPGQVIEGILTRDDTNPGIWWILTHDACVCPVKRESVKLVSNGSREV